VVAGVGYVIKEIFYSLQGEGFHTGRPAVFCRFSGCNLWSGREQDRATSVCSFCDTDIRGTDGPGGGKYEDSTELVLALLNHWTSEQPPFLICTGGEPLLQLDKALVEELKRNNFEIAIETNGTLSAPTGIDWICVSPKKGTNLILDHGHELKLVFPQRDFQPEMFENLKFEHFYLQPLNGHENKTNTRLAVEYCMQHPMWKLSLQTQKYLGVK